MKLTQTKHRKVTTILRLLAAAATSVLIPSVASASSWSPTLLVNTESFQSIDSGDGTTDRELRFGDTTVEKLIYEISGSRFRFTRSLHVSGAITATGSLTISGATILNDAGGDNDTQIQGDNDVNLVFVDASSDRVGIGAPTPDTKLEVVGTISGSAIRTIGTLSASGSVFLEGSLTGATIAGFGLTNCSDETQTLLWNSSTGKFSCGVDAGAGSLTITDGDARYVNQSGDTMTGALNIDLTSGFRGLNVVEMASGALIHAEKALSSSGTLVWEGAGSGNSLNLAGGNLTFSAAGATVFNELGIDADTRFEGDTDANLFFLDASLDRIGIGTATPDTKLEVIGTISGSTVYARESLRSSGSLVWEGAASGNSLTVSGNITLRNQTYSFPIAQTANGFLRTDGAGNLTWTTSLGNGSGDVLSLHPEYPNATYFGSGSAQVGQLTLSGGTTGLENSYVWTSTKSAIQDYWTSVRVQLPPNFSSWDPVKPVEFRYKTGSGAAAVNHLTVRMKDTAGADRVLTGGSALANTAWTTANITGPEAGGTWTAKNYFTVFIKTAANNASAAWGTANAAAGFLNFNWETSNP